MRRINWTEAMLSQLAELYPVETTAHTAYMLQIGVTAVKAKARELGLEKLAKSRWLDRAGHISRHFDNRLTASMLCPKRNYPRWIGNWRESWGICHSNIKE